MKNRKKRRKAPVVPGLSGNDMAIGLTGEWLAKATKMSIDGTLTESEERFMDDLLSRHISRGEDLVFEIALGLLEEDADARRLLMEEIALQSENTVVVLPSENGEPVPMAASLFAIPFAVTSPDGSPPPRNIERGTVNSLREAFRKNGLIGKTEPLLFYDGFLDPVTVQMPPSQRLSLINDLVHNQRPEILDQVFAQHIQEEENMMEKHHAGLNLRFVLGVSLSKDDQTPIFDTDGDQRSWDEDVIAIFREHKAVPLLPPTGLSDAIEIGFDQQRKLSVLSALSFYDGIATSHGGKCDVKIHPGADGEHLQVFFLLPDGNTIGQIAWPIFPQDHQYENVAKPLEDLIAEERGGHETQDDITCGSTDGFFLQDRTGLLH